MLPELDRQQVLRWADSRNNALPVRARGQIRYEVHLTATSAPIWNASRPGGLTSGRTGPDSPIARRRYTKTQNKWSLYWRDRNIRFHLYDLVAPSVHVDDLPAEIDRDGTGIFWG